MAKLSVKHPDCFAAWVHYRRVEKSDKVSEWQPAPARRTASEGPDWPVPMTMASKRVLILLSRE